MVQLAHPGVSPDVSPELIAKIPPIVDVDAHLVEPPDIWTPRLPGEVPRGGTARRVPPRGLDRAPGRGLHRGARHRGPRRRVVELRGHDDLAEAPHRGVGLQARGDHAHRHHLRRDPPRLLAGARPPRRHGRQRRRGAALLPELPALRGPDLPLGQGQGARRAVRLRLQRLDGRRVVRPERRPPPPAVHRAAVGRRARGRRDPSQRGAWRARGRVHRDPRVPRPPEHPHRLLGPVLRTRARRRPPSSACTSVRARRRCRRRRTRPTRCPRR